MGVVEVDAAGTVTEAESNGDGGGEQRGRKKGQSPNVAKEFSLARGTALPEINRGFTRTAPVHDALKGIVETPADHGVPFELYVYGEDERAKDSAAAQAANLRKTYKGADGWVFRVGPSEQAAGRLALWVQYR